LSGFNSTILIADDPTSQPTTCFLGFPNTAYTLISEVFLDRIINPSYFEGYQRPGLRSRTEITTIKALSDVQHTLPAVVRILRHESVTPFGEFLAQRKTHFSGNNSPYSNQYIDRHASPFDTEIPPLISRLSRRLDGFEDKKTGLRATLVLAKQSHMC
jgi:hypothetical protein